MTTINDELCLRLLQQRGIKATGIRILILNTMLQTSQTLSLVNLEEILGTVDKSTIFRTITHFHERHLVHSVDDGSGALKYGVCREECNCHIADLHTHFHCELCDKTICMENIPTPIVTLPEGFVLKSINYVVKGICPTCEKKNHKI